MTLEPLQIGRFEPKIPRQTRVKRAASRTRPEERDEVVALLFNVSDIAASSRRIERLLEDDNGEEEVDPD